MASTSGSGAPRFHFAPGATDYTAGPGRRGDSCPHTGDRQDGASLGSSFSGGPSVRCLGDPDGASSGRGRGRAEGNPLGPLRCDERRGLRRSGQPEFSFFFGRARSPQQFPGQRSDQSHTRDHTKPLTTGTFSEWSSQALPPAWPWFPAPLKSLSSALEQVNCPQRLGLKTHDSAQMLLGS